MLLMLVCLCACLALSLGVVSVAGVFDIAAGQFDLTTRITPPDVDSLSGGERACIAGLALLCLVLPCLSLRRGLAVLAAFAVCLATIQWLFVPFDVRFVGAFVVSLLVITCVYLLVRAVISSLTLRRANHYLRQYAPPQIVDHYLTTHSDTPSGESRDMTIMFCDIKRFTGISERLDPEKLPGWLNRFFDVVCEIVVRHDGTIDKYIGDSVMAFWGAPEKSDTHASDALRAAKEIIPAVEALSRELVEQGLPPIAVGIGLSTGSAHVGHLGSHDRMTYTVVGDAVNTADRLQRCTGVYDLSLVVNDRMTEQVPDYLFRELDTVHVKGRQRFVRIFQPVCHEDEAVPDTYRRLQMHRKAMQFYRRGMWVDAEKLFRALGEDPGERAFYSRYVERLVNIRQSEPSADTSFVIDFTQKIG